MNETFYPASPQHVKRERERARKLKSTSWWKKKIKSSICYLCEKKIPQNRLTMEHLVPLIRGGLSSKNNIVACCKPCNNNKKYHTIVEKRLKK